MSQLLVDDGLLDDFAAAVFALRRWLMQIGEEHPDMDTGPIDDLLRRYTEETGKPPPRVRGDL